MGEYEAALILALVAVAGASRARFPKGADLVRPKGWSHDKAAFVRYLDVALIPNVLQPIDADAAWLTTEWRGRKYTIAEAIYEGFRCHLFHEAATAPDILLNVDDWALSASGRDGRFVLGLGWLEHIIWSVIDDENLAPEFDDLRPPGIRDLIFSGDGTQDEFEAALIERSGLSPNRLFFLKRVIAVYGPVAMAKLTDEQMREFWEVGVSHGQNRYGLIGGAINALTVLAGGRDYGVRPQPFFLRDGHQQRLLSEAGLEVVRTMCANYAMRDRIYAPWRPERRDDIDCAE